MTDSTPTPALPAATPPRTVLDTRPNTSVVAPNASALTQLHVQSQRLLGPFKARPDTLKTQGGAADAPWAKRHATEATQGSEALKLPELYAATADDKVLETTSGLPTEATDASKSPSSGTPAEPTTATSQTVGTPTAPATFESKLLTPWRETAPWASSSWLSALGPVPVGAVGTGALLIMAALGDKSGGSAASDTSAPVLQSATLADSAGTQLVLSYNEALSTTLPAASAFQVLVDGVVTPVTAVARGSDRTTLTLTLSTPVTSPKSVSVSIHDAGVIKDETGNVAATFRDQSVAITDKVAPALLSSNAYTNADGTVIVLRYAEDLLASGKPSASAFGVKVDGATVNVTAVDVFGDSVRLKLGTPITAANPVVQLSYAQPSDNALALQDAAGNHALALGTSGGIRVTHSQDSAAPTLGTAASAAAAAGQQSRQIRLTFTEALDASTLPDVSSLAVDLSSGGSTRSVGISAVKINGAVLVLTLTEAVNDPLAGLRVRYSAPASNPLQDWAGNDVAAFERSVATADAVSPTVVSSRFTSDRKLELTFDETLASLGADKAAYTLTANDGAALKPVSSTISGKTVTLTFDTAVQTGKAATLTYVAPANDATVLNQALQDAIGNDSANLSYVVDATAPSLNSARTSSNGLQIELNYSESLLSPNASGTPVTPAVSTAAFRVVKGNGLESTVSSVSVSGSQVLLNLTSALLPGETVSVFYQAPTANIGVDNAAIQDTNGNDAASLGSGVNGQAVVNRVAPAITGAVLDSQSAAFDKVVVSFNEAISTSSLPNPSAFTIKVGGVTQTISSLSRSGNDLVLTLTNPIASAGELRVAYSQPGTNPLVDADSNAIGNSDLAYGQVITGSTGNDTLTGAAGRVDYFLGSLGNDTLSGLGSTDTFALPDFGSNGPQSGVQTLKDFGFKKGIGTLQGSTEADVLDLSQMLDGYTLGANLASYLQFDKDANSKLVLKIDHNGGTSFVATATLVFDNVTVNGSNQVVAGGQLVSEGSDNLLLTQVLAHLMAQNQLVVL